MLLLGRRPARMRPALLARTSVLPRQNLGAGGIRFRRAFQSFQRNPWGASPHGPHPTTIIGPMISKIFIAAQGSFPTSMLLLGRRRRVCAPAPSARTSVLPKAKPRRRRNSFPAEQPQSFQRNPWGACAPRDRPHHNGPHDIKDVHSCSRFLSLLPCCRWAVVGRGASCRRCSFYVDFLALSRGNGASGMPRPTAHRFGLPDSQAGSPAHPRWRVSHERPEKALDGEAASIMPWRWELSWAACLQKADAPAPYSSSLAFLSMYSGRSLL